MVRGIDDRPGWTLGLTGQYADLPAYQIVNDAHDCFLDVSSRLVGLEYGRNGAAVVSHPLWPAIEAERNRLAEWLSIVGADATAAAAISEEVRLLGRTADEAFGGLDAAGRG